MNFVRKTEFRAEKPRALVLAAGLGTRLRPLTEKIPKPLLPVIARPLIENVFANLHGLGVSEIAVNAHHLARQVEDFLRGGTCFGQSVLVSREEPRILGTGGAIKRLRPFLENSDPFVVANGDTLSKPDLAAAAAEHKKSGALATMILKRDERAARFGAVETDASGAVLDIAGLVGKKGAESGLFIGTHFLSPEIFTHMPEADVFCIIRQVYVPLLAKSPGAVRAVFTDAPFFDLGTPEDYAEAQFELLRSLRAAFPRAFAGLEEKESGIFLSLDAKIHPDARLLSPCAVCAGAIIGAGAQVGPDAVAGAGATVAPGSLLTRAVLPPGETFAGRGRPASI